MHTLYNSVPGQLSAVFLILRPSSKFFILLQSSGYNMHNFFVLSSSSSSIHGCEDRI